MKKHLPALGLLAIVFALSAITVGFQVSRLPSDYLVTRQAQRHLAVLDHTIIAPWCYRPLSDWMIVAYHKFIAQDIGWVVLFTSFRFFQQAVILLLAFWLYRKYGLKWWGALLGLGMLTVSCMTAWRNSDLSFSTYSEIAFCLGTVLLVLYRKYWWLIPVSVFAAMNRETHLLTLLTLLWVTWASWDKGEDMDWCDHRDARTWLVCSLVWAFATHLFLRFVWIPNPPVVAYPEAHGRLLNFFTFNVGFGESWMALLGLLNVAVVGFLLRDKWFNRMTIGLTVVPIIAAFFLCYVQESRVFLPGLSISLIPAAALWFQGLTDKEQHASHKEGSQDTARDA